MRPPGAPAGVTIAVEQLRRRVPGGIGTYAEGLLAGLATLADRERPPVRLLASRARAYPDPLDRFGFPVDASRLPGALLVRAWDAGLRFDARSAVTHAVSLAAPPARRGLVCAVHDLAWRRTPSSYPARGLAWHEAALARSLRRAAAFVVPSRIVADDLLEAAPGLCDEQVAVIEEGSDHLPEPDDEATTQLLERLGPAGPAADGGYLLAVGTLEPRKNLARLVAAYGAARPDLRAPWPLLVVGPAGWGPGLEDPPEGVALTGKVSAGVLAGLYRGARCVAYVPLAEGFGLPVVEAMRARTPVVSSDVPSAAGATLLVDPGEVDSIAAGLLIAANDEVRRSELVAAGAARVEGVTWARAARAHVALWARVAAGDRGG